MKNITYEIENQFLSKYACKSADTKGRERYLEPCPMRTDFQRDRDRIIHCKAFRRLKHKTQVFLSPEGDHYRTRLTHTLEVAQIARGIARALRLNEDLTESIALGHDLGHTPFGHAGEGALRQLTHFEHNEQSLRVVDVLEDEFKGMNLTFEVRDGILNHKLSCKPSTLEGRVVSYADRIAYLNHDIDDAIRAGLMTEDDIPTEVSSVIGSGHRVRINNLIRDIVDNSADKPIISQSTQYERATDTLRDFLFENLYTNSVAKLEEIRAVNMIQYLFKYFMDNPNAMPSAYGSLSERFGMQQAVCDYIATMTDRFAVAVFEGLFVPKGWQKL